MKTFNPLEYPTFERCVTDAGEYRMIPFADWYPSDFKDVPALEKETGELISVFYSPMCNCMFSTNGGRRIEPQDLDFWLCTVTR